MTDKQADKEGLQEKGYIKLPSPDSKEYQKLGEIIRDYYVQQCGNPEWVLPVFQHTDKVLALLKEK